MSRKDARGIKQKSKARHYRHQRKLIKAYGLGVLGFKLMLSENPTVRECQKKTELFDFSLENNT